MTPGGGLQCRRNFSDCTLRCSSACAPRGPLALLLFPLKGTWNSIHNLYYINWSNNKHMYNINRHNYMVFKFYVLVHYQNPENHASTFSIVLIFLFTDTCTCICQIQILLSKGKSGNNLYKVKNPQKNIFVKIVLQTAKNC